VRASTWVRDSHELFDYESANLRRKVLEFNQSKSIIRHDDELSEVAESDLFRRNGEAMLNRLKDYMLK
jgi:hypothetical protein